MWMVDGAVWIYGWFEILMVGLGMMGRIMLSYLFSCFLSNCRDEDNE